MKPSSLALMLLVALNTVSGCSAPPPQPASVREFPLTGEVLAIKPDKSEVQVKHDEVKGFMDAMTMWFTIKDPRLLDGIAPGGLHLVARPARDQRRRDDVTRQSLPREIAIQAIPARARLVGEAQRRSLPLEAANQLVDIGVARPNLADEHRRIGPAPRRVRDGNRFFVDIQPDVERYRLRHG